MTFSDLKGAIRRVQFFGLISSPMHLPFDQQQPNLARYRQSVCDGRLSKGQSLSHHKEARPVTLEFLGPLRSLRFSTHLTCSDKKFAW